MLHPRLCRVQANRKKCAGEGGGAGRGEVEMGHSCTVAYLRHCACKLFMGMDVGCYALHDKKKKVRDLFFAAHRSGSIRNRSFCAVQL